MRTKKSIDEFFFNVTRWYGSERAFKDGLHASGGIPIGSVWIMGGVISLQPCRTRPPIAKARKYSPFSGVVFPRAIRRGRPQFKNQYTPN